MCSTFPSPGAITATLAAVGLSSDPVKRRRQLAALADGARRRAASIDARIAELDAGEAEPRSADEPIIEASEPGSSEGSTTIASGTYGPVPSVAVATPPVTVDEDELEDVDEPADVDEHQAADDEHPEPSRRLLLAAQALGVKPK